MLTHKTSSMKVKLQVKRLQVHNRQNKNKSFVNLL